MQASRLDGCQSNSFLTLLIYLQCSNNDFGGGDISRGVLYGPGVRVDFLSADFSRYLSSIPSAIKRVLEAINVQCSGMISFKCLV